MELAISDQSVKKTATNKKLRFRSVGHKSRPIKKKNKHVNKRIEDFAARKEQIRKGTKRGAAGTIDKEEEKENDTCV